MADTLTTITTFINSPPGQLVAGGVLAGIVWKFFERVEAVLTEDTKLEIAIWLLDLKVGQTIAAWPITYSKVLATVFGEKIMSFRSLWRSALLTAALVTLTWLWETFRLA